MTLYQKVFRIDGDASIEVTPKSTGGGSLGGNLFTSAREWTYNTYGGPGVYETFDQGLIALMSKDAVSPWGNYSDAGYRIITKADGTMDALPFMKAMAALCSYGVRDEGLSHSQKLNQAKSRHLEMRCGHVTNFVLANAASVGVTARQVHFLNVTAQDNFDDGHVACEAQINGEWALFDVPNDCAFDDGSGNLLSMKDVIVAGVDNVTRQMIARPRVASGITGPESWAHIFYEMKLGSPQLLTSWLSRVYEVPGISEGGGVVWGLPDHLSSYASTLTNYPGSNGTWSVLPWNDWVATYY